MVDLADIFDHLLWPDAVTLDIIEARAKVLHEDFYFWLRDRRHRRQIPHQLESVEYEQVRNPNAQDGLWVIDGRRRAVYGKMSLPPRDRHAAAAKLNR